MSRAPHSPHRPGRRLRLRAPRLHPRLRARVTLAATAVPVALAVSLMTAPDALANFITPKAGGSPNANEIHSLYLILLYISAVVFVLVEGALIYSVFKFRAKKGAVAAQIHGNTRLEIGWTLGAALILVVLTVVTFIKLPAIVNPPDSSSGGLALTASVTEPSPPNGKKLTICIQGRQFIWRYTYGDGCLENAFTDKLPYSFTTMVVPEHTTVVLDIQSTDVIHSWWIPSLGGKVDAVPGYTTYTWFQALHTGFFHGQCAELCGINHAAMVAYVKVVTPAQYQAWLARQGQLITAQNDQVAQLRQILTQSNNLGS